MTEPPEHWVGKPKDEYEYADEQYRRRVMFLWVAVVLMGFLLVGGAALLITRPDIMQRLLPSDYPATRNAEAFGLQQTAQALQVTALHNAQQASQEALNVQGTRAVITMQQAQLDQTATALSRAAAASQAAMIQHATQIAFDLIQTRTMLSQAETRVALEFAATQGAIAPQTASGLPTATPSPIIADAPAVPIADDFAAGISGGVWQSNAADWLMSGQGTLTAQGAGAWLLTRQQNFGDYMLEVFFTPQAGTAGDYAALLNLTPDNPNAGAALRLVGDGQQITRLVLQNINRDSLIAGDTALFAAGEMITEMPVTNLPSADALIYLRVTVLNRRIIVSVNESTLLDMQVLDLPPRGGIGIRMTPGVRIHLIRVTPM